MTQLEKEILQVCQQSISSAIQQNLTGYSSPLAKIINGVVAQNEEALTSIVKDAFNSVIMTKDFKKSVVESFHHKVAKTLVGHLDGSIDQAVNALRQDPTIKAKMILAIENIVEKELKKN